jgi:excisionase family DNA binding protein
MLDKYQDTKEELLRLFSRMTDEIRMEPFSDALNDIEVFTTLPRLAWGLSEVSNATGLSVPFLRAEVRAGRLPVRRFGRRVLVRDEDLKDYLSRGSDRHNNFS